VHRDRRDRQQRHGRLPVTVRGAAEQVGSLVTALTGLGQGPLVVKAQQVQASLSRGNLDSARGQLGALVNSTAAAARSGRLSAADAGAVTAAANRVLAVLG
jgi:hypothetical protein